MNALAVNNLLSDKSLKNASRTAIGMIIMLTTAVALAGTNTAFGGAVTTLTAWLSGSLGILISLAVFTTGIMITVTKHSLMPVAVAAAAAFAISVGPTILSGMFTATIA